MESISFDLLLFPFLFCFVLSFLLIPDESWIENFQRATGWGAAAVLAIISFGVIVDFLGPSESPGNFTASGISTVNASEAIMALAIGVIGLVITGMTGMALSAAWRAKDLSVNAENIMREYKAGLQKSEQERILFTTQTLAHIQAIDLKAANSEKSAFSVLLSGIRAEDQKEEIEILVALVDEPEFLNQLGEVTIPKGISAYLRILVDNEEIDLVRKSKLISLVMTCEGEN
ncbi:MAG: hypothetical protein COB08_004320 [Rhodobacteraceae bacterium]|nr:hypothetical protein [Paracoccaceae bacterium]